MTRSPAARSAAGRGTRHPVPLALALVLLVTLSSFMSPVHAQGPPGVLRPAEGQVLATAVHTLQQDGPGVTRDRVVLLEMFTATWCPPCAPADRAVDRLLSERSPTLDAAAWANGTAGAGELGLAVLEYHPFPDMGAEDPFGVPEGNDRMVRKYGAFWFPSVYVGGTLEDAPDDRSNTVDVGLEELSYRRYTQMIESAAAVPSVFVIGLDASAGVDPTTGNATDRVDVRASLEAKLPVAGPLFVQPVVWQDHVRFAGSNEIDDHRMTVRALGPRTTIEAPEAGSIRHLDWQIPVPSQTDLDKAGVALIVEAAWGDHEPDPLPDRLMAFAGGFALVAATAVFVSLRTKRAPAQVQDEAAPDPQADEAKQEDRT